LEDVETTIMVITEQNMKTSKKAPIKVQNKPKAVEPCAYAAQASIPIIRPASWIDQELTHQRWPGRAPRKKM
jgi:hypothetical protein